MATWSLPRRKASRGIRFSWLRWPKMPSWRSHFPAEAPVSPEIDYEFLARELKVAGGSIKNIVLNAAFLAAAAQDGGPGRVNGHTGAIGMREIMHGARREFAKMGKFWNE